MSNVYFTSMRTRPGGDNLLQKLDKLITKGGIGDIDMKGKYVAIKMHFGEAGNLAYLRPSFARIVAEKVKSLGGMPYLVDCNTLYVGGRHNGIDHMRTAEMNGFNSVTTGCHVVIGDGIKGTDEVLVPVKNGEVVKTAYIGAGVDSADIIISLAHFKGHEGAGFGGSMKNIGMGCGSIAGKKDQHSSGQPQVDATNCIGCKLCATQCNHGAVKFVDNKAQIDHSKCAGCGRCTGVCPKHCISPVEGNAEIVLNKKIVEYTQAVIQDKPSFHINVIMDVSPNCDCHSENDVPIIPNVGMLCSSDVVAVDVASADLCMQQTPIVNSAYGDACSCGCDHDHEHHHEHTNDHFHFIHPETKWQVQIEHGEKIGLGSSIYKLITIG